MVSITCTEALTCNPGFQVLSPVDLLRRQLRPEEMTWGPYFQLWSGMTISLRVFPLLRKYMQWLRAELSWPQMIKNNRSSPAWGRNARKWREMKKPWGRGGVVLGQEPILAPVVNTDNINLMAKCKKTHLKVFFFTICAFPAILTNHYFILLKKMRTWIFDIPESFFKYPVSL